MLSKNNRRKGHDYERKIVKELKELFENDKICTSRSESKSLDDAKIDIADLDNVLPCYFQLKSTLNIPNIPLLNEQVGLKDKPFCILWNAREKVNTNQKSRGEFAIITKEFLYKLIKQYDREK